MVVPDTFVHNKGSSRRRQFDSYRGPITGHDNIMQGKRLLESSGSGVTCLPLIPRLKAYFQFKVSLSSSS